MMIDFTKMHGAGNDFVVIDAVERPSACLPNTFKRLLIGTPASAAIRYSLLSLRNVATRISNTRFSMRMGQVQASAAMVLDVWADLFVNRVFLPNRR